MFISTQNKINEFQKHLAEKSMVDHHLLKLLNDVYWENFLTALENAPFDQAKFFTKLCKTLKANVKLIFSCLIIYKSPGPGKCALKPSIFIKYGEFKFDPSQLMDFTSTILEYTRIQLDSDHPFFIRAENENQYFFHVPIIRRSQREIRVGELNFWLASQQGIEFPGRHVRHFADLVAKKMEDETYRKVEGMIAEAGALPNKEIKEVIKIWMNGIQRIFDCSYSVGLILNRYHSEAAPDRSSLPSRPPQRTFEVVKEELCGRYLKKFQKSKATGLWINENEGLLAEMLRFQQENPANRHCCLTFHQRTPNGIEYECVETGSIGKGVRANEIEENEKTVVYAPLNADGMQLGFLKLAYDEKTVLWNLEKKLLQKICGALAERIRNSFIYTLNIEQLKFLPQIKNMFEETDNLKLLEFDQLYDMLAKLTDTIIDITGIDNLAIGYITKNSKQEKIIRFTHPRGWSEKAHKKYADLEINRGLSGLAMRLKRDVYLSPVEIGAEANDLESTIYVNEKIRDFTDIRKSPECKSNPEYKNLAEYYIKTTEEKVYANFVFLIKYKEIVLGVINVEVTEKNWDRFMGLVYVHFFKTLADQLALFFYRLRLAKEDLHISRALEELGKYARVSSTAAYKAILFSLSEIFGVPQMKISSWDRKTGKFHFKPPRGSSETISIGFSSEEDRKLSTKNGAIRLNDACLLELEHHAEKYHTFYLYIPSIEAYVPNLQNPEIKNAFDKLKENPEFVSYMGLILGKTDRKPEVLELFSNKKNAFDELLIDHSFFESWISQIKMALQFAFEIHSRVTEPQRPKLVSEKPVVINTAGKVIPILPPDQLGLEHGLIGAGKSMAELKNQISIIAKSECPTVLIQGEMGTDKELIARAIHLCSPRHDKPFMRVNCGALAEGNLEAELWGREKWELAGAVKPKNGKFELAHGGTIFLDDIGEVSSSLQMRLLRVLQEKEFERVGGEETVKVDVRVIVATNQNLRKKVQLGQFRDDLWYRINVIEISAIPLRKLIREKESNLLTIISSIIQEKHKTEKITGITKESYKRLLQYPFRGNIRELEGMIEKAIVFKNRSTPALDIAINMIRKMPPQRKPAAHRRLAAIMFTDMVGYSAQTQKNESLALKLLEEQRRLLRSIFPKHGGREVETIGDAFLLEFSSALEAVHCAVAIQETLFNRNASLLKDQQIKIRVGIHIGDVVVRGKQVLGDGVNIAARLEPLAEAGGICISEDVARQIHNKIELPLQKLARRRLKNIQHPVIVYAIKLPWMERKTSAESPEALQ